MGLSGHACHVGSDPGHPTCSPLHPPPQPNHSSFSTDLLCSTALHTPPRLIPSPPLDHGHPGSGSRSEAELYLDARVVEDEEKRIRNLPLTPKGEWSRGLGNFVVGAGQCSAVHKFVPSHLVYRCRI